MEKQIQDSIHRYVEIPWDVADASCGYAFDMGASIVKLIYIEKCDWADRKCRKPDSKCRLSIANIPMGYTSGEKAIDQIVAFICRNVHVVEKKCDRTVQTVYGNGFGCCLFAGTFRSRLNSKLQALLEFHGLAQGLQFILKYVKKQDILEKPSRDCFSEVRKYLDTMFEAATRMPEDMPMVLDKNASPAKGCGCKRNYWIPSEHFGEPCKILGQDIEYPVLLMSCGSALGLILFQCDGSFKVLDGLSSCGKTVMGLASLLTGTHNYNDLLCLAERGDNHAVDVCRDDLGHLLLDNEQHRDPEMNDVYTAFLRNPEHLDTVGYGTDFGKADGKSLNEFRREDLARALLNLIVHNLVHYVHATSREHRVRQVLGCGGFLLHPLVRSMVSGQWTRLNYVRQVLIMGQDEKTQTPIHFLRNSAHVGALGAFLTPHLRKCSTCSGSQHSQCLANQ